jgi:hypothetical protein
MMMMMMIIVIIIESSATAEGVEFVVNYWPVIDTTELFEVLLMDIFVL